MRTVTPNVDRVSEVRARLGESVYWSAREDRLYWVDIPGRKLFATTAASGVTDTVDFPEETGFVVPCDDGTCLVGQENSVLHHDPSTGERQTHIALEPDDPTTRANDAVCDAQGRLLVGTMRMAPPGTPPAPVGRLHQIGGGRALGDLDSALAIPNGLAFGPEGDVLYWADTPQRLVWRVDYDPATGRAGPKRPFAELTGDEGRPDGAAMDAEGCYWVAAIWGWQLLRYTPEGVLDMAVRLPVQRPTKLAFGGAGYDTVFVTSASENLTDPESQPLAGQLIALRLGIRGMPVNAYRLG